MIDAGIDILVSAGMDKKRMLFDKFEDMSSPAPVIDNTKCVLCDECLMVKPQQNCIIEASQITRNSNGDITSYERVAPAVSSPLYYNSLFIDESECIRCYACVEACPTKAISPSNNRDYKTLREAFSDCG